MAEQKAGSDRNAEHWDEQATLALDYAMARPMGDTKGFCAALRDAADFQRRAEEARHDQ